MILILLVFRGHSCHHLLSTLYESMLPVRKIYLQVFCIQERLLLVGI